MMLFVVLISICYTSSGQETGGFVQRSQMDLATQLLSKLSNPGENTIFAPSSIWTGIGMVYLGLDGSSRRQFSQAFGFPAERQKFLAEVKKYKTVDTEFVKNANMMTVEESAEIRNNYGNLVKNTFGAQPFRFQLAEKSKTAQRSINKWVENKSAGKINDLLPPGSVTPNTKLVLVNVVHYKSEWNKIFDDAEPAPFTLSNGGTVEAKMMSADVTVKRGESRDGATVVEVPLLDVQHSLMLVLPSKGQSVSSIVNSLTNSNSDLRTMITEQKGLEEASVTLKLPKFTVKQRHELSDALIAAYPGIQEVFTPNADFSLMAKNSQGFYLDKIHHKAIMEADEKGLEASGATGIAITLYSFFTPDQQIVFDRPFIFFLVDNERDLPIFAGAIEDPTN